MFMYLLIQLIKQPVKTTRTRDTARQNTCNLLLQPILIYFMSSNLIRKMYNYLYQTDALCKAFGGGAQENHSITKNLVVIRWHHVEVIW